MTYQTYYLKKIHLGSVALYSFILSLILWLVISLPFYLLRSILMDVFYRVFWGSATQGNISFFGLFWFMLPAVVFSSLIALVNVTGTLIYNLISIKMKGIQVVLVQENQVRSDEPFSDGDFRGKQVEGKENSADIEIISAGKSEEV